MVLNLKDKAVLVTGGASGIGRATVLEFAREGAKVMIADLDTEGGLASARMARELGGEAAFLKTDVTDSSQVQAMVAGTVAAFGRLDCAFNNAGIESSQTRLEELARAEWLKLIQTNLTSVFLCLKYEITQMLKQGGGGAIVNAGSNASWSGRALMAPYSASKGGVLALTRSAATDYARQNIRVNCTCPGPIRTPMLERIYGDLDQAAAKRGPADRIAEPREVAQTVVWLCSEAASFINGQGILIDGGVGIRKSRFAGSRPR